MTIADYIILVGLSLGTIGALLLAFDPMFRLGTQGQIAKKEASLENVRKGRKATQDGWKKLLEPKPANEAYIRMEIEKEREEGDKEERRLESELKGYKEKYEKEVFVKGWLGVRLICAAFVLQGIGVWMQSKKEAQADERGTHVHSIPSAASPLDIPRCIGPFKPGNDRGSEAEKAAKLIAGKLKEEMSQRHLVSLLVLGSVDKQPLRESVKRKFVSNRGLAEARASWVEGKLQDLLQVHWPNVVIVSSGPTIEAKNAEERERDRFVEVYPVWEAMTSQPREPVTSNATKLVLGKGCPAPN
jgi:hypothetical protein